MGLQANNFFMSTDKKNEALAFLKAHNAGVLASAGTDGKPHASAIYYVADENFNIYFMTLFASRKYQAMRANPAVAFTVGTLDVPQTLQIEGTATELTHEEEKTERISQIIEILMSSSTHYAPITKLDRSEVVVMWIKPSWVRWADYASGETGTDKVLTELPLS